MALVKVKQLAKMMNVSTRRVQQLAASGMPRAKKGMYDDNKCLQWFVRFLQGALDKKSVPTGDGSYSGLTKERVRSLQADAELKEIELAEKRGHLVRIEQVHKCFVDLVHVTKAQIMATPYGIAQDVLGETSRVMVQAIVEKKLKEALNHLADDGSNYSPIGNR